MKRAIKWWPKFNLTSPEKSDFIFGATYGLVTIQAYHELDMMKMAQGKNKTIIGMLRAQPKPLMRKVRTSRAKAPFLG